MSEVRSLSKTYRVHRRPPGLAAPLRSLFRRTYEPVRALSEVSFDIGAGERVGFLGPNLYDIPKAQADATVKTLVELLDIGALVGKPTRQLSLGERMKCELVAALLHQPRVLFLDEPTIGLDVAMQARMRQFIREYNERTGATVLLTSHYMEDVVALCPRVVVIDKGRVVV